MTDLIVFLHFGIGLPAKQPAHLETAVSFASSNTEYLHKVTKNFYI